MMTGAATVFVVQDIAASLDFYRDQLGFDVTFRYGEPTFYACLCRDEVAIHVLLGTHTSRAAGNGGVAVFVQDVDALYAEVIARGATVAKPPQDYAYGMREFNVIDPDGNQLTFGMGIDRP